MWFRRVFAQMNGFLFAFFWCSSMSADRQQLLMMVWRLRRQVFDRNGGKVFQSPFGAVPLFRFRKQVILLHVSSLFDNIFRVQAQVRFPYSVTIDFSGILYGDHTLVILCLSVDLFISRFLLAYLSMRLVAYLVWLGLIHMSQISGTGRNLKKGGHNRKKFRE